LNHAQTSAPGDPPPIVFPGQEVRAGSCRKTPEIAGTWKQYSGRKFSGFFPMISGRFLTESTRSWQEFTGKNPDNFRPEYCFHVLAISGVFLHDTVTFPHLSCRIQWPESSTWASVISEYNL
jgi:hypothetical protein